MARKGLAQANTLRSNNTSSTGYGSVYADEISGHRTVADLSALYDLNDWQLSSSGDNTSNDAIGQLWYVVSAGEYYQLKDWGNRNVAAGWSKFSAGSGDSAITIDSALSSTSTNPVQNKVVNAAIEGKVDKETGKGLSTNDFTTDNKNTLDTIVSKDITLSQIDTCGYSNIATLISEVKESQREYIFNVKDIYSKLHVFTDSLGHALYQKLETPCTLDSNYNLSSSHNDGVVYVYLRAYINTPSSMYAKNTGYSSSSKEWSPWIIVDTLGVATKSVISTNNTLMSYFGRVYYASIDKDSSSSSKLVFNTYHIGGSQQSAYTNRELEIPEATTSCNGLLSITDKAKIDALGDDFTGFTTLSDDDIDSMWNALT